MKTRTQIRISNAPPEKGTRSKVLMVLRGTLAAGVLAFGLGLGDVALAADPDPNTSDDARQKYLDLLRGTKKRLETDKLLNTPVPAAPVYPIYPGDAKPSARDRVGTQLQNRIDDAKKTMPKPKPKPKPYAGGGAGSGGHAGGGAGGGGAGDGRQAASGTDGGGAEGTTKVSHDQELSMPRKPHRKRSVPVRPT